MGSGTSDGGSAFANPTPTQPRRNNENVHTYVLTQGQNFGPLLPGKRGSKKIECSLFGDMAMVHRLCPSLALTPIDALQSDGSGTLRTETTAIALTQTTQWIYERGMQELQDAAVENFHDIPVQIGKWDWSGKWSHPVINCHVTHLTFDNPSSDKGCVRPLRNAPIFLGLGSRH